HILLLERGAALSFSEVGRDHLRNQRLSIYGHNAGPELEGNPRVFVDPSGHQRTVQPHEADYHNNAACVGGGTRVYGAQAWLSILQTSAWRALMACRRAARWQIGHLVTTTLNLFTNARNGN